MAKLIITAEFEPDESDSMAEKYGPDGLQELLMHSPFGLTDIDITVGESED